MGIGPFKSSSCTCDKSLQYSYKSEVAEPISKFGNPKPDRFHIERVYENQNGWLVAQVTYPDAKNYEGRKILLYKTTSARLYAAKFLDPHFCDDKTHLSPFARFEPTNAGWLAAVELCKTMDMK